jgi:hypothetical protein
MKTNRTSKAVHYNLVYKYPPEPFWTAEECRAIAEKFRRMEMALQGWLDVEKELEGKYDFRGTHEALAFDPLTQ